MSEPTFTVQLTIGERNRLLFGLGMYTAEVIKCNGVEGAARMIELANRLCELELSKPLEGEMDLLYPDFATEGGK